jgi:cytoskeletal protein RodZ
MQQISIAELAQITRIPARILHQIESDSFDELPAEVFVRGFLRAYARAVGVVEDEILEWYQRGYVSDSEESVPIPSVSTPDGGHSFGIAIALVILLILFTLALSFVLRPRYRDVPVELSYYDRANTNEIYIGHRPKIRKLS